LHELELNEVQEQRLQAISDRAVQSTNHIFHEGLQLDQRLRDFLAAAELLLAKPHLQVEQLQRLLQSVQTLHHTTP
jgi:hypothetical protein